MNLRKLLCLMVVLALAFTFVLTGCQKETTDVPGDDAVEQPSGDDAAEDPAEQGEESAYNWTADDIAEPVELTWYVIGATEQEDQDMVEEEINAYLADKINATVDIVFMDYDPYQDTVGTLLAGGEKIDVCFTSGWARTPAYRQFAADGMFVPLNDYLAEGGILYGTREIIGDSFMNATQINGTNYAIPCNKEQAHNWGFLFRKDIVEELSLDVDSVDSLEALEPILAAVHEAHPEMIPLVTATGENCYRLLDWNTFSSDDIPGALYPDNRDNTVINQFAMPETEALYKTMQSYYDAGYIRSDADTYSDWQNDLESGQGFCISQSMKPGKDVEYSQGSAYDWIQVDVTPAVMSNREADGSMMAIPVNSENPDRAAMLLEIANTDKYFNNMLNFGVEGTHFTKVSDNVIELSEENAGWRPNITWVFPNQFMNYTMSSEDPDKFVNFTAYNQSAIPLNNLGFVFNSADVTNEISALQAVSLVYTPQLNAGTGDVDTLLPEFLEELDAAGADTVIAAMQEQYDAWLAK